jgi:transaldolase
MADLVTLFQHGQSLWLEAIDRELLANGSLKQLVSVGIRGMTSNLKVFQQRLSASKTYDDTLRDLIQADPQMSEKTLYEWLTVQDAQRAADILRDVYDSSQGLDGFVSLALPPPLAADTIAILEAAQHLWRAVDRPNLMIEIPATRQGVVAMERLLAEGINVNVTLLFAASRYAEVWNAYLRGLAMNPEPAKVAAVASFAISDLDTEVDAALEAYGTPEAVALKGKIAIANAKLVYGHYKQRIKETAFLEQQQRGARAQRLLWSDISSQGSDRPNLGYLEALIGPDTVSAVSLETYEAFRYRGEGRLSLEQDLDVAHRKLAALKDLGIDLDRIAQELEEKEIAARAENYTQVLATLRDKRFQATQDFAGH